MAEDQGGGAAPKDVGDISSDSKDSVAYETYRKTVSEAKRLKEQLAEIKAQKDADDQAKLAEQGKYKEMVEKLQTDLKTKDADFKKKEAFFVQSNLKSTVSRYAKELGAIGEATEEIYEVAKSKGLLSSLEIKEDYSVNGDQIKEALANYRRRARGSSKSQSQRPEILQLVATPVADHRLRNLPSFRSSNWQS